MKTLYENLSDQIKELEKRWNSTTSNFLRLTYSKAIKKIQERKMNLTVEEAEQII